MSGYNSFIFRDYDIRGIYGTDFDESFAYNLGFSSCIFARSGNILIGRDFRRGSDLLSKSFTDGAINAGCDVIDIGTVPVPLLYYAAKHLKTSLGIMVTASHLPAGWNGFKFCDRTGIPISSDTGLNDIRTLIGSNRKTEKTGSLTSLSILDIYADYVTNLINIHRKLKVVFDYGDSVTSLIVPIIARKLNIEFYDINNSISSDFPNRSSELTQSSMSKLMDTVIQMKADVGIAYDGDGDRMGLVDNNGNVYYSGNTVIQLFCQMLSSSLRNNSVVYDVTCSDAVRDTILNLGGTPIESKVGQAHLAKLAIASEAIFGGQYSCHMCFRENGYIDDAIYSSFKILDLLSLRKCSLADIAQAIKEYPHTEIEDVPIEERRKKSIMRKIDDEFKNRGYNINHLDGLKIELEDSWCLIRPSNTSPVIRINAEGKTIEEAMRLHKACADIVKGVIKNDQ